MQELFLSLGSGSGGALASNVSSEFAGNAGWFKIIQVYETVTVRRCFFFLFGKQLFFLVIEEGGTGRGYAHAHLGG